MGEELKSVALCLLDDLNISEAVKLDEFEIRFYQPAELQAMFLNTGLESLALEASDQLKVYGEFPWTRFEHPISADKVKTAFHRCLQQRGLSYAHAGIRSWWPFDDLLRTLNLLKPTGGPVIGRQFYYWLEPLTEPTKHIDRVIYGEPLWDYERPDSEAIHPLLFEYDLDPSDVRQFSELRKQLAQCLSADSMPDNSHLKTAIHYFENGDRKITPRPLPGSFDAIDPLMSYEAALEALLICENERGRVAEKLSGRVAAMMERAKRTEDKIEDFTRRVFCLRSKVAHGAKPIEQIENLIAHRANDGIPEDWGERPPIPNGDYKNLLIDDGLFFSGFLVNLRELTRMGIRFFCDELSAGQDKTSTIQRLDALN